MKILLLGARAPACLEWANALHKSGHTVLAADSVRYPLCRSSRFVDIFFHVPAPAINRKAWARKLVDIVKKHDVELVIPTCEEAFHLALSLADIPCRCLVSAPQLMEQLHNKGEFATMAWQWGIPAPETTVLTKPPRTVSTEAVYKPIFSRFANETVIRPSKLAKINPSSEHPWIEQEYVGGDEMCSYGLYNNGRILAHACYPAKYRVGQGATIHSSPISDQEIFSFMEQFGLDTGYTGQVGFDFIRGEHGLRVIECNPRATSGVHLLPREAFDMVTDMDGHIPDKDLPPKMVGMAMVLFGFPKACMDGSIKEFVKDFKEADDVLSIRRDPLPALLQLLGLAEIWVKSLLQGVSLLDATTTDIRYNGDK